MMGDTENDRPEGSLNLRSLDLNLLTVFEAIFRTGSVSQAAKGLGMSQPTVSNALARLRAHFSDRLFVRGDGGMKPTPKALALAPPIIEALGALRRGLALKGDFDPTTTKRNFRLLIHDFSVPSVVPTLVRLLDESNSNCTVEAVTPDWSRPHEALTTGDADIIIDIAMEEQRGVTLEPLMDAEGVCIVREGHPRIGHHLSAEQFAQHGHVILRKDMRLHLPTAKLVKAAAIERRTPAILPNASDLATVVATTDLIAIVPLRYAEIIAPIFRLRILPVPFHYPTTKVFLRWAEDRHDDPGVRWLRDTIRSIFST